MFSLLVTSVPFLQLCGLSLWQDVPNGSEDPAAESRGHYSHFTLPPSPGTLVLPCSSSHPVVTLFNLLSNNRRKLFTLIYLWFRKFSSFLWLLLCWFSMPTWPIRVAGECKRWCKAKAERMHGSEWQLHREQQPQLIINSALSVFFKLLS